MANKRSREVANGAPETPQIPTPVADLPATDAIPESVPGSEALDPPSDGAPAGYEQFREQRIKENLERMQKLGIVDLSLKLKSSVAVKRTPRNFSSDRKTPIRASSLLATEPRRRSSRLQNVTPVSYVEPKEEGKRMKDYILLEEGAKPEFYTEEHEKLLGSTELEWTLFVDGYAADGKRIYDPIKGKTCHQCRQKTLGLRTHCCNCQLVQGQFCGDCLYMRYGEHVLEAKKNPDWICPACRGICNCSLCRQAKGWAPTGAMYKKITKLGYKSVAHFLIQNKRAPPATEPEEDVSKTPYSAKRSLAFTEMEVLPDGKEPSKKMISGQKLDYEEKENGESKAGKGEQNVGDKDRENKDEKIEQECEEGKENICPETEIENDHQMEDVSSPDHAKNSCEPKTDSVARRTRSRNKEENPDASEATAKIEEAVEKEVVSIATKSRRAKKLCAQTDSLQDSVARRLRSRINGA